VKVGVVQFGSTPKLEISLDSYKSKEELKKKMKKIHYRYRDYISVIVCLSGLSTSCVEDEKYLTPFYIFETLSTQPWGSCVYNTLSTCVCMCVGVRCVMMDDFMRLN